MLRRIVSVVVGLFVILLLVGVTDFILAEMFPTQLRKADGSPAFPKLPLVLLMIGYSFVYAGVSGYLTASIAPRSPRAHAVALCALLVLISIIFAIVNPYQHPWWYLLSCTLVIALGCIGGGSLKAHRIRAAA
jgi:peptidoglycan/LPS O-acetylase OafA/YrhL